METHYIQIIKTVVTLIPLLIARLLIVKTIKRIALKFNFGLERIRVTYRIINLLFLLISGIMLAGIWGVQRSELLLFVTSTVTVLGIAFFAQWSILSNITSGLVLFFNHPLKIGDHIQIFEKDFKVEGRLKDISIFFLHIETLDGNRITVPNSIALQKTILVVPNKEDLDEE
jgi:small-conductance mechanosensitive channel